VQPNSQKIPNKKTIEAMALQGHGHGLERFNMVETYLRVGTIPVPKIRYLIQSLGIIP
jgi:hypothetical protein